MDNPFISIWRLLRRTPTPVIPHLKYGELQLRLAEALMWRDEDVSMGAIPSPFIKQPADVLKRYLDDAEYLITFVKYKKSSNNA